MKFNITEEQLKVVGKAGLRIGKSIVIEGTKAVILKGTAAAINASFENGIDGIKDLTLDDVLKDTKESKKKNRKGLFGKKKEVVEIIEVEDTEVTE